MPLTTVVAGHVCLDVIPAIPGAIDMLPGRLYEVGGATLGTGGPVSNTGVAMRILGMPTLLMGKIGDDTFGDAIVRLFEAISPGLAGGMIRIPGETTSYSVVINIPGKDRTFLHCCGANHTFVAADVRYEALGDAGLFHFGYPTLMGKTYERNGDELVSMFSQVKAKGLTTSLDMAMPDPGGPSGAAPWALILERTLPHVDIFMPSADELLYMLQRELYGQGDALSGPQVSALGQRLIAMGSAVAAIKMGERGLYIRTAGKARLKAMGRAQPTGDCLETWANREMWVPIFSVDRVVSAVGAGDSTIAGFLTGLLHGLELEDAARGANMVGAMNVQAANALDGLRSWSETLAVMSPRLVVELKAPGPGWRKQPGTHLWLGPLDRKG